MRARIQIAALQLSAVSETISPSASISARQSFSLQQLSGYQL
jgi:hypothetical protein